VAENGSISPQRHYTTCGQRGGRPKFNHGQTMADKKKQKTKNLNKTICLFCIKVHRKINLLLYFLSSAVRCPLYWNLFSSVAVCSYVKCYLLPDTSKASKRKTKVKRGTCSPHYNESFKYQINVAELYTRTLQVRFILTHDS